MCSGGVQGWKELCHVQGRRHDVRIPATSYLVPLFTLIYLVLFHLLPPYHLDVPCYLNNRQRYCSVWSERLGLFTVLMYLFYCCFEIQVPGSRPQSLSLIDLHYVPFGIISCT